MHQQTDALQAIQELAQSVPGLSERLINVHNHCVHFSAVDLEEAIRADLYFLHELARLVKVIE